MTSKLVQITSNQQQETQRKSLRSSVETSKKEQDGECLGKVSFSYTLEGASRAGLVHFSAIPVQKALAGTVLCTSRAYARDTSRVLCTTVPYPCKRRFPVRFRVLTGLTHATLRADCGSCVLARLMHATGLCATGGCRIQASTRDRLVHKSGLCTRHYGI